MRAKQSTNHQGHIRKQICDSQLEFYKITELTEFYLFMLFSNINRNNLIIFLFHPFQLIIHCSEQQKQIQATPVHATHFPTQGYSGYCQYAILNKTARNILIHTSFRVCVMCVCFWRIRWAKGYTTKKKKKD